MDSNEEQLTGWRLVELLWPLNDMFRARLHEFRALEYDPRFEAEADAAIEEYVDNPSSGAWAKYRPEVWRVLLERHKQAMTAAAYMEATGEGTISIPAGLSEEQQRLALMLIWLYRMKLPFPPSDRSAASPDEEPPLPQGRPN